MDSEDAISVILLKLDQVEAKVDYLIEKEVLTIEDAAKYLDVSKGYLYQLCRERKIPHFKPAGKRIYFKRTEIHEWAFSRRVRTRKQLEKEARKRIRGLRHGAHLDKKVK